MTFKFFHQNNTFFFKIMSKKKVDKVETSNFKQKFIFKIMSKKRSDKVETSNFKQINNQTRTDSSQIQDHLHTPQR